MAKQKLSLSEARRIALAAQGFDRPRPKSRIGAARIAETIRKLGLVQIDYSNVLAPAHYVVLFSRLGPYDRALFDDMVYRRREFTEQWAHEMSIVPMEMWPLLGYRRETHRPRPWAFSEFIAKNPEYVRLALELVRDRGALTGDDLPTPDNHTRRIPGAWVSLTRAVLEAKFGCGVLAVADRRSNFQRVFDLAERVVPAEHHAVRVPAAEARRELIKIAARAQGIAAAADLADYFRMPVRDARPAIRELEECGAIECVEVEHWREPAWLYPGAKAPRVVNAKALLAPFDPLVWYRPRLLRLFGFDYRFEIFVPEAKRRWGVYVLPFLLGDRMVARVDLKSDRAAGRLLVVAAHIEAGAEPEAVAGPLADELELLAHWLGLGAVVVTRRGQLGRALASAIEYRSGQRSK